MNLTLNRIYDTGEATIGMLLVDGKLQCFSLEDQKQTKKVMHETRIPAGIYQLKLRKEDTPLTKKYRIKYPWFKHHIEITNVLGFVGIYIHIGLNDDWSSGCVLLGDTVNKDGTLLNSVQAYIRFYSLIYPLLDKGEKIMLEINDEVA